MPDYDYQADARPFSKVVADIGGQDDPKLYLGELVNAFGERGMGAMMLFFGLLNLIAGAVPGSTTILGIPLLVVSIQLVFRGDQLWLPRWALRRSIDRSTYRRAVGRALPALRKIERLTRPRLSIMTSDASEILIGVVSSVLCVILILPIWGGNLAPALIVATFGFGLMQRDGALVIVGWLMFAAAGIAVWLAWNIVSEFLFAGLTWAGNLIGR
ncbi:hypothetical protein ASG17_11145 [Brevundimonas sp. Leaf363]|uniref:exopolysaccharide biosynthesis protein n=1 Tax=Brevundimonas sp. Leaf363 TaxID=1736353 RepID=UPI0007003CB2|nr:exopolysaccharide biosynthesis protein [Brevundimonas sp. Leaf363]KQS54204.1 hypothetical protein ASG17_11145 [Brevundimonas sp. Leaf363]